MTSDDPQILELLERYSEAVSAGDVGVQQELLSANPDLGPFVRCLDALERMAVERPAARRPAQDPRTVETIVLGATPPAPPIGEVEEFPRPFGRYELLDELGRGGMGVVYKARHLDLNRVVALKMIRSQQLASPEELRRFHVEAKSAARLKHPHIVSIHDIGQIGNQHYFTMDYVPGTSLATLTGRGPLDPEMASACVAHVCRAVHYLHTHGIIHRDLKPHNILIDPQGRPYVTDFGLAKICEQDSSETQSGAILGTPSYMSPEQAAGRQRDLSPQSDVWSLGAILYETLTGRPPFREETYVDTLLQVMEGEPTLPNQLNRSVPAELEWVCMKCLSKDPADRYATAFELADDLDRYTRGEATLARPTGLTGRFGRWVRREPALAIRVAVLLAATLILQLRRWAEPASLPNYPYLMGVFGAWGAGSVILQRLLQRPRWAELARYVWSLVDVALFTLLIILVHAPRGPLLVTYPFFIAASGLLFRVPLVAMTTGACLVSYLVTLWHLPEEVPPRHYVAVFICVLLAVGGITGVQVRRVRALSRFYDRPTGV